VTVDASRLLGLDAADDAEAWRAAGFTVDGDAVLLDGLTLHLAGRADHARGGLTGWRLDPPSALDGIGATAAPPAEAPAAVAAPHPNAVVAVDHVVVGTPDLDRTTTAFAEAGWAPRRSARHPDGTRAMRFFLVPTATGKVVIEVIQPEATRDPDAPARLWGLALVVADIDAAASLLGDRLGTPKRAVQPGRRIATLRTDALGIGTAVALMTPRPADL